MLIGFQKMNSIWIFRQTKPINSADIAVDVIQGLAAAERSMKSQSVLTLVSEE